MSRIKNNYESRSRTYLTRRTPIIIRLDGKAFHTYTRGLDKPFDEGLIEDMQQTAIYLCQNIQGAKCAYVQSDEISILVTDYDTLTTDAWFNYEVQKMTSISASITTGKFNQLRTYRVLGNSDDELTTCWNISQINLANFDSCVFNIPKEEVANYFLARQKDAVKNSISMLAQSLYSHKELNLKNTNQMQEMCFKKGCNWNDLPFEQKRGSFIIKNTYVNDELAIVYPDVTYLPEHYGKLEYNPIDKTCKRFGCEDFLEEETDCWTSIKIEKVRTKWEVVETPFTFIEDNFKNFI
jgi:tRNA(His) 5'-end guanylyltransferase